MPFQSNVNFTGQVIFHVLDQEAKQEQWENSSGGEREIKEKKWWLQKLVAWREKKGTLYMSFYKEISSWPRRRETTD